MQNTVNKLREATSGQPPQELEPLLFLVTFRIDERQYALHLSTVSRVLPMVEITPLPKAPAVVIGVFGLHDRVVSVVDLRRRFRLPQREWGLQDHLLLACTVRRTLAVAADEVQGVVAVPPSAITSSDAVVPGIGHVAAIARLPDGLLLIQDLDQFLSLDEEAQLDAALEAGP